MGRIEWTHHPTADGLRLTVGYVNCAEKYFIANVAEAEASRHTEATAHGGPTATKGTGN